jgi:hypothetical protein
MILNKFTKGAGIATGYGLDGGGSVLGSGKRFFSLHSVQTGSEAQPASYLMGAGDSFSGGKEGRT